MYRVNRSEAAAAPPVWLQTRQGTELLSTGGNKTNTVTRCLDLLASIGTKVETLVVLSVVLIVSSKGLQYTC